MRSSEHTDSQTSELFPKEPQYYVVDFKALCRRKGINPAVFTHHSDLTEDSPISNHVAFLYDHILSLPYASECNGDFSKSDKIARPLHGVQHAVRVAKLVMVFVNLSRRHGDAQAQELTEAEVKRMQLMAMFHDCAREHDLKDATDYESAIILFHYLTNVVGMNAAEAKFYAETVGNKEESAELVHFTLWLDNETKQCNGYILSMIPEQILSRQSAQLECLYDGDCLDVMRVRTKYRGEMLKFYKNIVTVTKSKLALEELAHLISEWRSIIEYQGDTYKHWDYNNKRFYEDRMAWERIDYSINEDVHPIVCALSKKLLSGEALQELVLIDISPYDPALRLTEKNLRAAMREGIAFTRSVCSPSAYTVSHPHETNAAFELRKLFRQAGIPANQRLNASTEKVGNRVRSVSMLEKGAGFYGRAGFIVLKPRLSSIKLVASSNMRTGFGKKSEFLSFFASQAQPTLEEIEQRLLALLLKLKLGGHGGADEKAKSSISAHTEVVSDMEGVDAVYYTTDPTLYRLQACRPFEQSNIHSQLIEAIYLRKLYRQFYLAGLAMTIEILGEEQGRKQFTGRFGDSPDLPIFFISGIHHVVHQIPEAELTDDFIIMYWKSLIRDYLKKSSLCLMTKYLLGIELEQLKIDAVSGNEATKRISSLGAADACYDDALKHRLNRELEELVLEHIADSEIDYCSMATEGLLNTKVEIVKIAFLSAVKYGHQNIVYQLLRLDRTLCEASYRQMYPLHIAASSHQPLMVRVLLEHFAHPDIKGPKGMRPLHCAVSVEDEECIRELLVLKVKVDAADEDGVTPLMIAADRDNTRIMQQLIAAGANVNAVTPKDETALTFAIRKGNLNAINLLLGCKLDLSSGGVVGEAVIAAIENHAMDIVDLLAAKGANLEAALQYAVIVNHYDACFVLLAKKASVAGVALNEHTIPDIAYLIYEAKRTLFKPN